MKKILLVGALLTSVFAPLAQAATTVKIATLYPKGTVALDKLYAAADEIKEKTEGRVKFKIYPGGVKQGNKSVLKQIKKGLLGGILAESGVFAPDFKDSQIYNAPMFFNNYEEVDAVRAELDPVIEAGFDAAGWNTFGLMEGGFAYVMTNNPVASLDQLKQQKLWLIADDPLVASIANGMGISPIYLGAGEVLTSLQTNSINAIVAPPSVAVILQWHNKVKYVTDVPFMYTYSTLAISDKIYNKISAEDQVIVRGILTEAVSMVDELNREDSLNAFNALQSIGIKSVAPTEQEVVVLESDSQKATQTLIDGGEFSQEIYDRMSSIIEKHRAQ